MEKGFLIEQLGARVREALQITHRASAEAKVDARSGGARAVNIARAQIRREEDARAALDALGVFRPRPWRRGEPIGLGAIVEVEDGETGKTLFIAPVGAGEELSGPEGDGIFQVVTPASPFGKALIGKRQGEIAEVTLQGDLTEWTITYVG